MAEYNIHVCCWRSLEAAAEKHGIDNESQLYDAISQCCLPKYFLNFPDDYAFGARDVFAFLRNSLDGDNRRAFDIIVASLMPDFLYYNVNRPKKAKKKAKAIPFEEINVRDLDLGPCNRSYYVSIGPASVLRLADFVNTLHSIPIDEHIRSIAEVDGSEELFKWDAFDEPYKLFQQMLKEWCFAITFARNNIGHGLLIHCA